MNEKAGACITRRGDSGLGSFDFFDLCVLATRLNAVCPRWMRVVSGSFDGVIQLGCRLVGDKKGGAGIRRFELEACGRQEVSSSAKILLLAGLIGRVSVPLYQRFIVKRWCNGSEVLLGRAPDGV